MSCPNIEAHTFLMPDYYPQFACKMGKCRHACCVGWPISISMQNYFRLLGMNCPKHLRKKLDVGMQVYDRPDPARYAYFVPDFQGDCPMRMADGRCSLHAEMGPAVLPDTFFGKNKGRTMEAKLSRFTKYFGLFFFVLALGATLLLLFF